MEEKFLKWVSEQGVSDEFTEYEDFKTSLSEALYTVSENNILEADCRLSLKDAILIWKLVEALRDDILYTFPDDLKM